MAVKLNTAGQPRVSRDLARSRWGRPGANGAEEATHTWQGTGMGKGALVPIEEGKQRCPKSPTRFLPAIHSVINGYFSANTFNIYFQQVAGGR